jgi:glutamyl/glutaminyl-tRNA synthetase
VLGKRSEFANRTIEENLELFEKMKTGEFKDGQHVLRAKIDMSASNMKMRDPLYIEFGMLNILEQMMNGVYILCMILLIVCLIILKVFLTQFVL